MCAAGMLRLVGMGLGGLRTRQHVLFADAARTRTPAESLWFVSHTYHTCTSTVRGFYIAGATSRWHPVRCEGCKGTFLSVVHHDVTPPELPLCHDSWLTRHYDVR